MLDFTGLQENLILLVDLEQALKFLKGRIEQLSIIIAITIIS